MKASKIEVENAINDYKKQKPQLTELLDFFYSVFNLKEQYIRQTSLILSSKEDIIQELKSGRYLMESITWSIDKNSFENIFKDLIKILKQRGENTDKFEKLFLNISDLIPTKFPELMDFVIKDKEDITQSEKDTLSYVLWHTLSVFYKKTAEIFNGIDYKTYWTKAICPLCGNLPKMSRLNREDGKRILACFLCWTEWLVPRISCAYCGNNSQDTLEYFYANGNKVYRVDICKVCNKYIKTIDEKLLGRNVNLEIEDNITYHLDTLAISKGYKNPFL